MDRCVRTDDSITICTLQKTQISKDADILMNTLYIAPYQPGQLTHCQFSFALSRAHYFPTLFGQLSKKVAWALKVEGLTLVLF